MTPGGRTKKRMEEEEKETIEEEENERISKDLVFLKHFIFYSSSDKGCWLFFREL